MEISKKYARRWNQFRGENQNNPLTIKELTQKAKEESLPYYVMVIRKLIEAGVLAEHKEHRTAKNQKYSTFTFTREPISWIQIKEAREQIYKYAKDAKQKKELQHKTLPPKNTNQEHHHPLKGLTGIAASDLVEELRSRGFMVTATKTIDL